MDQQAKCASLDTLCGALAYAMGIKAPEAAAPANPQLTALIDQAFGGEKADRVFMFNPDAVARWLVEKYPELLEEVTKRAQLALPLETVMPSVTPVCFGTMYTGAQPEVHGIRKYEKPVITIDTLFDALIRAGKKPVIIAYGQVSMSKIYLEREMDYFIFPTMEEANAKAAQLILEDQHDFIALYNGSYDYNMHRSGPESVRALGELRVNASIFAMMDEMIAQHWGHHRTLIGFAMDHGCHEIDDGLGSHGLDMPEDLLITHFYHTRGGKETV